MQKLLPYLSLMLLIASFCQPVCGEEDGFTSLFNGRDLRGWIGATDQYRVEDGLLVLPKGRGGKLLTEKQFDNFMDSVIAHRRWNSGWQSTAAAAAAAVAAASKTRVFADLQ